MGAPTPFRTLVRPMTAHALALAVPLLLLAPMVVFGDRYFVDWENHLYLIDRQSDAIRETGLPSAFLHTAETGLFYPQPAFYGATLYAIGGYLAVATGSSWAAYVLLWALSVAMAYGGTWWLARQAGVGALLAHLPALVVVTSAYALTNVYSRGAFSEFVAGSAIPLSLASGWALVRAERARARDWALLFGSVAILVGSHVATLLWTLALCALFATIAWAAGGRPTRLPSVRRVGLAAWAVAAALLVNAWSLAPVLLWGRSTVIYEISEHVIGTAILRPEWLFHPGRVSPPGSTTPDLFLQIPVLALAWGLVVTAAAVPGGTRRERGMWVAAVSLLMLLLLLVTWGGIWAVVPDVLRAIQFPGRLLTHVTLLVAALVALGLLAARRLPRSRAIVSAAVAVAAAGSALALHQAWSAQRYGSAGELIESSLHVPATWYAVRDYRHLRPAAVRRPARVLAPSPARVRGDRLLIGSAAPGVYASNVVYSELVHGFGGVRVVGRDRDGLAVLEVPAAGPGDAGVEPARPPAVAAARVVSALALVAALATVAALARPVRRERGALLL